jgi:hypothetical protein
VVLTGRLRCRPIQRLLGVYALGAAPEDLVSHIERHLISCRPCLAESDRLTGTALWLMLLSEDEACRLDDGDDGDRSPAAG